MQGLTGTYFLRLTVEYGGKLHSSNQYWLSTKPETLDWKKSTWYYTPTQSFADYTALKQLQQVKLNVTNTTEHPGNEDVTHVTVENPSKALAFFVKVKVNKGNGGEVLPIFYEDNYFSLLPGEKREISARYRSSDLAGATPAVEVSGWNVEPVVQ